MEANIADQIGTVAINKPAKPEVISRSAAVIKYQGPISSVSAYRATNGQYFRGRFRTLRLIAIGKRIMAPIATLPKTTTEGAISSTAIFKNR
jgi:hypothetical protein